MTILLFVSVTSIALFLAFKKFAPATQSAAKESAKSLLLKITQLLGMLGALGLSAYIGFLPKLNELLAYVSLNLDSVWDMVAAIIVVINGGWAILKPSIEEAVSRIQSAKQL